jgi:uncharacterized membrane protein
VRILIDPIWPWSTLWLLLITASPAVLTCIALAGLVTFALPIWMQRPPLGRGRREVLAGCAVAILFLLGYVARTTGASAGSAGGRLPLLVLGLVLLPMGLAGLGVATYLGLGKVAPRRLRGIIALRLLALLLTLIAILRPSLGFPDRTQPRGQVIVAMDESRSMTVRDESGKRSRWEVLLQSVQECEPLVRRLADAGIDLKIVRFAGETTDFDFAAPGKPEGNRTDIGAMLRTLLERRDPRTRARGMLVASDGADNGTAVPALAEAARWRALPCPVHTFACGNPSTTLKQNDVAITAISTSPSPFVPVKSKLTVKVSVDARGYENTKARVRLFMEGVDGKDKEMQANDVRLPLTTGNEIEVTCNAPPKPGEYKVRVTVETPEKDAFPANNVIETFVTVSKEGISVLLVDKTRAYEPKYILRALQGDARIRVDMVWLEKGQADISKAASLFRFDEHPYDVIIFGDVSASQIRAHDPKALAKIEELVGRGAGFLMIGGYSSFGSGDWKGTEIEPMLPIDLAEGGQEESQVKIVPTPDGLRVTPYLFRLDDAKDLKATWEKLAKLDGMSLLKMRNPRRGIETVLAQTQDGAPILVTQNYARPGKDGKPGKDTAPGRVLAFGGDSTYRWIRDEESRRLHARFWRQMVVWLARQEDAEGSVWVKPDVRRLPVRAALGFQVGLRGKGGALDIPGGTYQVEVTKPAGVKKMVPIARGRENRGTFALTDAPGVYKIAVKGSGKDPSGGNIEGTASARVIVYDDDLEMTRPAADHDFLHKLAAAGGGEFHRVEQLHTFLTRLLEDPKLEGKPKLDLRPDWRGTTRSPFLVLFFLLFVGVVSGEWWLRRRAGLV